MIFSTRNNQFEQPNQRQSGVSLMLAILVLAAVTAIAFSLATIVFIEVRIAGDALRTEPTLYAAFGVTEEALFQYKRFYSGPNLDVASCQGSADANGVCSLNGVMLSLPGTQPIAFDDSPRVEFLPAHTSKVLAMFSISDPTHYYSQQYTSLGIAMLPPTSATVSVKVNYVNDQDVTTTVLDTSVPPSVINFTNFSASGQYELQLSNTSNYDASVSITTIRCDNTSGICVPGATPAGLPFVGEQVLRIKADYQGLNRTYQVRIPVP